MKRLINSFGISLLLVMAMLFAKPVDAQPGGVGVSINFQTFYDQLSPYGDWIDYPEYGYTWRPNVGSDFRPYSSNGNWVYTNDNDWMWNSGYDWGWAPFHYGRWFYDPMYGWLWVPGYDWSPAWVSWRGGGDYYGWAPIRPGISINIGFGNYNPPYDYWTFAPCRYMNSPLIGRYYYPYRNNVNIFNRTTIINNYYGRGTARGRSGGYYVNGPRRADVERYTGRINSVSVRSMDRPGRASVSRNSISVYRPTVSRSNTRSTYAPRSVQNYDRNNVASRNAATRSTNMRSNREGNNRFNTAPRRQDAINNSATRQGRGQIQRSDNINGNEPVRNQQIQQRSRNEDARQEQNGVQRSQRIGNNDARNQQQMEQRSAQMQQQRQQQMGQRNVQVQQQRSQQMEQRNAQIQQQRQQQIEQRNAQAQQQRSQQMEQRNAQMQQQRLQQMQQRQSQMRSREVQSQRQSSPSFESRSSGRSSGGSVERSGSRGRRG